MAGLVKTQTTQYSNLHQILEQLVAQDSPKSSVCCRCSQKLMPVAECPSEVTPESVAADCDQLVPGDNASSQQPIPHDVESSFCLHQNENTSLFDISPFLKPEPVFKQSSGIQPSLSIASKKVDSPTGQLTGSPRLVKSLYMKKPNNRKQQQRAGKENLHEILRERRRVIGGARKTNPRTPVQTRARAKRPRTNLHPLAAKSNEEYDTVPNVDCRPSDNSVFLNTSLVERATAPIQSPPGKPVISHSILV